jgi:hypothetical protein
MTPTGNHGLGATLLHGKKSLLSAMSDGNHFARRTLRSEVAKSDGAA